MPWFERYNPHVPDHPTKVNELGHEVYSLSISVCVDTRPKILLKDKRKLIPLLSAWELPVATFLQKLAEIVSAECDEQSVKNFEALSGDLRNILQTGTAEEGANAAFKILLAILSADAEQIPIPVLGGKRTANTEAAVKIIQECENIRLEKLRANLPVPSCSGLVDAVSKKYPEYFEKKNGGEPYSTAAVCSNWQDIRRYSKFLNAQKNSSG